MTREEAAEIIDPKTADEALSEYDCRMRILAKKEAATLAASVLRSRQEMAPNDPLSREQLMQMDGEPVWIELIVDTVDQKNGWAICYFDSVSAAVTQRWTTWTLWYEDYGKTWLAYRRKPSE